MEKRQISMLLVLRGVGAMSKPTAGWNGRGGVVFGPFTYRYLAFIKGGVSQKRDEPRGGRPTSSRTRPRRAAPFG